MVKPIRIYLASSFGRKEELSEYEKKIISLGFESSSQWLKESVPPDSKLSNVSSEYLVQNGKRDLEDIRKSEILILFSASPLVPVPRGGHHVEFGYALALNKKIVVVGPKQNIFHYLPGVTHLPDWLTAVEYLIGYGNK